MLTPRRYRALGSLVAIILLAASCSSESNSTDERIAELERQIASLENETKDVSGSSTTATSTSLDQPVATLPSTTTVDARSPSVELEWFGSSGEEDFPYFRFLAWVANPNEDPLKNVSVRWDAIDSAGAIVASFDYMLPSIEAGFSLPYIGGAGGAFLSGTPERVELFLTSPGTLSPGDTSPFFTVTETDLVDSDGSGEFGTYHVNAVAQSFPDRAATGYQLNINWILRNSDGEVVEADFGANNAIGDTIPPDSTLKFSQFVLSTESSTSGVPTDVATYVYEDAP